MVDKKPDNRVFAGVMAFLTVLAGGLAYVRTRDKTHDKPPVVVSTATTATEDTVGPPTDTVTSTEDTDTSATIGEPLPEIVLVPDTETTKVGKMRPSRPRASCEAGDISNAERLSLYPGYGWLKERCDLVAMYRINHPDIHIANWLCDAGYDSPGVLTDYSETPDIGLEGEEMRYNVLKVTDDHGFDKDVLFDDPVKVGTKADFQAPCWRYHKWQFIGGWIGYFDQKTGKRVPKP